MDFHEKILKSVFENELNRKKAYNFPELLEISRKNFPNIKNGLGVKLNRLIENLEVEGVFCRILDEEGNPKFLLTNNFKRIEGEVEWQNDRFAILHELVNGRRTGIHFLINNNESEKVINGDRVIAKLIPEEYRSRGDEVIIISRKDKAISKFIAKIVEIEETEHEKLSKCVLLEKNFRFPFLFERKGKDEKFDYQVGDFISGIISSDSDFIRNEDLLFDFEFKKNLGSINDHGIESLLALEWMNYSKINIGEKIDLDELKLSLNKKDEDRKDLTHLNFITIDGAESKDLDDALFIKKTKDGYNILVAISDVSYFIKEDSYLDRLAQHQNQSYYFPHKVLNMFPNELSDDIISLNQDNKAKKVMICDITINNEYQLQNYNIYKALIKNKARLTYNDIDYYAEKTKCVDFSNYSMVGARKIYLNEDDFITTDVIELLLLVSINLRKNRNVNDTQYHDEFVPIIDTYSGKINNMKIRPRNSLSGNLVEEYMLLANYCASDYMLKNQAVNSIYRNQNAPLNKEKDRLPPASYSNKNTGHYSLNFDHYTHFTSPIRRYVDLMVHREISNILQNKKIDINPILNDIIEKSNAVSRKFKQAQKKALSWLLIEYLKGQQEKYFKANIIHTFNTGWLVECDSLKIQVYIGKPKDKKEIDFIESKNSITIELVELDFCKEKINFKIKNDRFY